MDSDAHSKPTAGCEQPSENNRVTSSTPPQNSQWKRCSFNYCPMFEKFVVQSLTDGYHSQYAPLYLTRLRQMKAVLKQHVGPNITERIINLKEGSTSTVVGTLYKQMPLLPSVLEEYAKERAILPHPNKASYISEQDSLFLEDESGRISLVGVCLDISNLVTGMVVAVKGVVMEGEIEVEEIVFPGLPKQMPLPSTDEDKYVILLSGINYAHNTAQIWFQMFVDFCCGLLGGSYDQRMNSKLVRVIIAGDSLGSGPDDVSDLRDSWERNRRNRPTSKEDTIVRNLSHLDIQLAQLASAVEVDIMPGEADPSNFNLP